LWVSLKSRSFSKPLYSFPFLPLWNRPRYKSPDGIPLKIAIWKHLRNRVARWFLFSPKLPIWVYFGGPWNGKCYIFVHLEYFTAVVYLMGIWLFCSRLVYFVSQIWYIVPRQIWQPCWEDELARAENQIEEAEEL
jgi:hypothetical protein